MRTRTLAVAAGVVGVLYAFPARGDGFNGQRFAPAVGAAGGFFVERANVADHLAFGFALFLNFADDPVVQTDRDTDEAVSRPLDSVLTLDLLASLGLFDVLELGIDLPIHALYDGDGLIADGQTLTPSAGIGDLRLLPKAQLVRTSGRDLQLVLGVAAPITLPTGDDRALRGAGGVTVEPRLLLGLLGRRWGVYLGAGYLINTADPPEELALGNEVTLGLAATFALSGERDILDLTVELAGGLHAGENGPGLVEFPLEALAGVIYRPHTDWQIYGGAGPGLTNGIGAPDFRIVLGVRYAPRRTGTAAYVDRDGDGIADVHDDCPDKPEDFDGFHDEDGCPEPDNDKDGIPDDDDECPDDPEEPGGDRDGCPERGSIIVEKGQIVIIGKIQFETDSDRIQRKSEPLLEQIADVMKNNPRMRVRIEGHTDDLGEEGYNQRLSEARAHSVKRALVERGVAARHLEARGYGESQPRAPNGTKAGRAKNRRVEFRVLD